MPTSPVASDYILGIDLGSNSVGWAMIGRTQGKPVGLLRAGVRVFDAGMEGDLESGQEESRNLKRRQMRSQRRQTRRRVRRLSKLFRMLQRFGLMPSAELSNPEERQELLNQLDREILTSDWFKSKRAGEGIKQPDQLMPFLLRAAALDERLEPHHLGRALYHLAQHRGFRSNRKAPPKKDEKPGEVEKGINELRDSMGDRTLGQYFASLDPFERRIRQRWTHRSMYEEEFKRIWEAQSGHYPALLTPERRKELYWAIFYQRKLKFPPNLVGCCELEPDETRAPRYSFLAQRCRLLQVVNNLEVALETTERKLTADERDDLAGALELEGDRTFNQVRKLLKLPKGARFNLERGGEKALRGNRTTSAFYKVFGERWLEMTAGEHEQALHDVLSLQDNDARQRRAVNHWKLGETAAGEFAKIKPEADYSNLSHKAMSRLLPLLETGSPYAEARHRLYPEQFKAAEELPFLPPLEIASDKRKIARWIEDNHLGEATSKPPDALAQIRNPAVTRSLTELRKVVNGILRLYGKPAQIRIELARDIKAPKKARQATAERNQENQKAREKMKGKILEQTGLGNPSREDIRRALLHEECGGICPYTGKPIDFRHLFGSESQFDIEHIIPYDRCFDNSFANLTLCHHHENRHVKGRQTPWEAYHSDEGHYLEIIDRVQRFHSPSAREKLRRFKMTKTDAQEFVTDFVDRQLNDTRYASRLAAKYLAMLFGGLSDDEHTRRVRVSSGGVTYEIRRAWGLNGILNDGPTTGGGAVPKTRNDHRHHAVDAVAIALSSDSAIQQLSRAAQQARERGQRKLSLEAPWPDFVDSVRTEIGRIIVSHRPKRKVSGALHEEKLYSKLLPLPDSPKGQKKAPRIRKRLEDLTKTELKDIADPTVRDMVQKKLAQLGGNSKKFNERENLPFFKTADGREIPIKSVRVVKRSKPFSLGKGASQRNVISESNHHLEIFADLNEHGEEVGWDGIVVRLEEAYKRVRTKVPVVQRDFGAKRQFKFSLAAGDVVECDDEYGGRRLLVVRGTSIEGGKTGRVGLVPINDARQKEEIVASNDYFRFPLAKLRKLHIRKVSVSPLGELGTAND